MKPVYEIKFLSNQDFDNLPKTETNGSDISDSLGFYNPYTNRIFIRHTMIPDLNKYLLEHEFDHVLEEHATDSDENGIRHKKKKGFASFLRMFYNPLNIPGLGPLSNQDKGILNTDNQSSTKNVPQSDSMSMDQGMGQNMMSSMNPLSQSQPIGDIQSSQASLNQGLNNQSVNPLADPYARYGQQQGRLVF